MMTLRGKDHMSNSSTVFVHVWCTYRESGVGILGIRTLSHRISFCDRDGASLRQMESVKNSGNTSCGVSILASFVMTVRGLETAERSG